MAERPEDGVGSSAPAASETPARRDRCLSAAEIVSLASLPPGEIPAELALHLAGCERCQRSALFGSSPRPSPREPPSLKRAFLWIGIILAAFGVFLASLLWLAGG
jgi:hypothetical protein